MDLGNINPSRLLKLKEPNARGVIYFTIREMSSCGKTIPEGSCKLSTEFNFSCRLILSLELRTEVTILKHVE